MTNALYSKLGVQLWQLIYQNNSPELRRDNYDYTKNNPWRY